MIDQLFDLLTKLGFKEPLHPPITHMPIGLVVGAAIFFLIAIIFRRKNFVLTARHVSILAFIFAFPTIILGVIDWIHFYHAAMFVPIIIKMVLAILLLIVLGIGIIVGSEIKAHSVTMTILYAIAFVCVIALGYYGSGILYGRGLGVGSSKPSVSGTSGHGVATAADTVHATPDTAGKKALALPGDHPPHTDSARAK